MLSDLLQKTKDALNTTTTTLSYLKKVCEGFVPVVGFQPCVGCVVASWLAAHAHTQHSHPSVSVFGLSLS